RAVTYPDASSTVPPSVPDTGLSAMSVCTATALAAVPASSHQSAAPTATTATASADHQPPRDGGGGALLSILSSCMRSAGSAIVPRYGSCWCSSGSGKDRQGYTNAGEPAVRARGPRRSPRLARGACAAAVHTKKAPSLG